MKVGVSGKQPENSFQCNSMEQRLCPRDGRGHRDHTGKETNPSIIGGCKSHFAQSAIGEKTSFLVLGLPTWVSYKLATELL